MNSPRDTAARDAASTIERARSLGIELFVDGDRLRFRTPKGALEPDLKVELQRWRTHIIELLRADPALGRPSGPSARTSLVSRPKEATTELSPQQEPIWLYQTLSPASTEYNICRVLRMRGVLNVDRLANALRDVVEHHSPLRTVLIEGQGGVFQQTLGVPEEVLRIQDLTNLQPATEDEEARRLALEERDRPFVLSKDPPLRALLLQRRDVNDLILTFHHIGADGASIPIFFRDLGASFEGSALPHLPVDYRDFAYWERAWWRDGTLQSEVEYWREHLSDAPTDLGFTTRGLGSGDPGYAPGFCSLRLDDDLTGNLKRFLRQEGATLFMGLLAAWAGALRRATGKRDMVIGVPNAGRTQAELRDLVGMFVSAVPARMTLGSRQTFRQLLAAAKEESLGSFARPNPPHSVLVDAMGQDPGSGAGLFQVALNLLPPVTIRDQSIGGVHFSEPDQGEYADLVGAASSFDLELYGRESGDEGICLDLACNRNLISGEFAEGVLTEVLRILELGPVDPDVALDSLLEFPEVAVDLRDLGRGGEGTVGARLEELARTVPDRSALSGVDGEELTYGEYYARAQCVAAAVLGRLPEEAPVAVMVPHGLDVGVALCGVLISGRPYVPVDPAYPPEHVRFMLEDSGAGLVLTVEALREQVGDLVQGAVEFVTLEEALAGFDGGGAGEGGRGGSDLRVPDLDSVAYMLYTSGSSGQPKAVVQTHRGLTRQARRYADLLELSFEDRLALTASISFDASLMDLFGGLVAGATVVPLDLRVLDLSKLPGVAEELGLTTLHLTPTVWRAVSELTGEASFHGLRALVFGGERVRAGDVAAFDLRFPETAVLVNLYGSSEHSFALAHRVDRGEEVAAAEIAIGMPVDDVEVVLVGDDGEVDPVVGEMVLRSAYGAVGYWNRPELEAATWVSLSGSGSFTEVHPLGDEPSGVRAYRTGDVVRRRPDGKYVYLGRTDDQFKVRGHRVEPGEVEAVLSMHPAVLEVGVHAPSGQDGEVVLTACLVWNEAVEGERSLAELADWCQDRLPSFMVPTAWVIMEDLPRTPSGKVNRKKLPHGEQEGVSAGAVGQSVAPRDALEEALAAVWQDVLHRQEIGVYDDFFALGGHSLNATQVVSRVSAVMGVEVPLRAVFEEPTIDGLARRVRETQLDTSAATLPPIESVDRGDRPPLSFSQERMWFIQQLQPDATAYNMARGVWLDGALDESALEQSFECIVSRHESLRTNIATVDGVPYQEITQHNPFRLERHDLSQLAEAERSAEAIRLASSVAARPFDLEADALFRVLLVRVAPERHLLSVVLHHSVGDLWSLGVLGVEFAAHYNAFVEGRPVEVPPLPVQYADFSIWQRSWLTGTLLDAEVSYWRDRLDGIQPLVLPTDRPRQATPSFAGARIGVDMPRELSEALRSVSIDTGVTQFMVLLAAFDVLLSRRTRVTDVAVGVPIANRTHVSIEPLAGTFVNTLVFRNDLSGDPTVRELLRRVREVAVDAYSHQHLPFEKLVIELNPERDMSRGPLVQVLFNVANAPQREVSWSGLEPTPEIIDNQGAQFDLTLSVRNDEQLVALLTYNTDLFDRRTAEAILAHYGNLLGEICARPDARLSELEMLSEAERSTLLVDWNDTATEYPKDSTFVSLFEDRARRTPDRVAVECGEQRLKYGDLNSRASALAVTLIGRGVGPGDRVAVLMDRGLEMLISLLAVMKTGAAYVPLDPAYPAQRNGFILEDSDAVILLTQREHAEDLVETSAEVLCLDEGAAFTDAMVVTESSTRAAAGPDDVAYVIYTSGSTGKPKGVEIPNRALVNFLWTMANRPGLGEHDVLAAVTTVSFDIAGLELYLPLLVGARIALLVRDETENAYRLAERLEEVSATVLQATPATWRMLIESGWEGAASLKALCGGEALPPDLAQALQTRVGELWNMYGPTETTIWSTIDRIENGSGPITIGRPIANTQIYILDEFGRPVPIGVPGEIHIGGDGLACGYRNRPDLTAERFVPNPFEGGDQRLMYRTGDLGRFFADGRIEHLGRMDFQVKIRGFRIELGEIESVLVSHDSIRDAVVVARDDRLVAYVIYEPNQELTVTEVRSFLQEELPAYMIPALVVPMDSFPLTPNGKTDRKALPDPYKHGSVATREYVEPSTKPERIIADVWSELLSVERIGTQDNFFDLGGHSLMAMQVVARVEQRLGVRLDPRTMFFQTLEQIAAGVSAAPEPAS